MYIFAGSLTVLWSLVILLFVPDSPLKLGSALSGRLFNNEDRVLLALRAAGKQEEEAVGRRRWSEVRQAGADPMIWVFGAMG